MIGFANFSGFGTGSNHNVAKAGAEEFPFLKNLVHETRGK